MKPHQHTDQIYTCPSCHQQVPFRVLGIQTWPENVAKATGFPATVRLLQCCNCYTSLLEPNLVVEDVTP